MPRSWEAWMLGGQDAMDVKRNGGKAGTTGWKMEDLFAGMREEERREGLRAESRGRKVFFND